MKKIIIVLIILMSFSSCNSTREVLNKIEETHLEVSIRATYNSTIKGDWMVTRLYKGELIRYNIYINAELVNLKKRRVKAMKEAVAKLQEMEAIRKEKLRL